LILICGSEDFEAFQFSVEDDGVAFFAFARLN